MEYVYKLPSLGDGVTGKVTEVHVKAGDVLTLEQIVIVVGTDKVDAEMPVDKAGKVKSVSVKVGDSIKEGDPILVLELEGAAAADAPAPVATAAPAPSPAPVVAAPVAESKSKPAAAPSPAPAASSANLRVSPLARKMAREMNVDLATVKASSGTRISFQDVLAAGQKNTAPASSGGAGFAPKALPDFNKFGATRREPMTRINQIIAENLSYQWSTVPHAWMLEKADITHLEELRQQNKDWVKEKGGSLTTTGILVKAIVSVLKRYPRFNASLDTTTNEIIYKDYYHIGVAVDTPRGLLVPVIRDADRKGLLEISIELGEVSKRTRDGKNKPEDMEGGTFAISNVGGIGSTTVLSIINFPNTAILGITKAQIEAVWMPEKGVFEPRMMMPMSIAFDHRVINGADASRFLVELKQILENPFMGWF